MPIRILVVDDASFIRDMVKKHLRDRIADVEVIDAVDGNRALAAMKQQTMDLILSDWEMPNMSGEELLRVVRSDERTAKTPFIMISSRGDRDHVVKAIQSGVSDYLSKPFTPDELLRKVFKQLNLIGKSPTASAPRSAATQGIAFASVDVLTGGREAVVTAAPAAAAAEKQSSVARQVKGKAQLRFANNMTCACVVRDISLQSFNGLIQRTDRLPALFDQAVVDIELGDQKELARLNGYVHALQAGDNRVDTQVIKISVRFVDNDMDKFEVLSKYIAQG
jgi:DNA-binding response OmpR family regulator